MVCPHLRLSEANFSSAGVQPECRMFCLVCLFHGSAGSGVGSGGVGKPSSSSPCLIDKFLRCTPKQSNFSKAPKTLLSSSQGTDNQFPDRNDCLSW